MRRILRTVCQSNVRIATGLAYTYIHTYIHTCTHCHFSQAMLRVDRGVITKVAIDWYCQVDVLAASTLTFLDYDEMAAVAISCQTGHALMHAPRFAHLSWSSPGCAICFWISGNRDSFTCEHCGLALCLDCLGIECPDNVCILCRIEETAPLPTVVPMHLHAYFLACELNDALTRKSNYSRFHGFTDVAFPWPY